MLPIEGVMGQLEECLKNSTNGVLIAPPGAGKTTRVPLALLNQDWLAGQRIIMLEPRRLATRAAARYMASSLGEQVGETVGYRIRLDTRIGLNTRIEVITEGILTRMLQSDPGLSGVGLVIFDEFHERSIHADLGLALCLESQKVLRPELRLLVMSATLETEPVAKLLGDAPVIISEGRIFPVETFYERSQDDSSPIGRVGQAVMAALGKHAGDILVFLPGAREIRQVAGDLIKADLGGRVKIATLHSSLGQNKQDEALLPSPPGQRKVVLSTAIAQTSITVQGVQVVIDSGLMRIPRFSPRTGMTRLETVAVSLAAADQRRGRAGRLGPGVCYRLWSSKAHERLALHSIPEIREADLVPLLLELAAWGIYNPGELAWLDQPPAAACEHAQGLLQQIGALGPDQKITPHGRRLAAAGIHPRLGHMIIRSIPLGMGGMACELAALLSRQDQLQQLTNQTGADIRECLVLLRRWKGTGHTKSSDGLDVVLRRLAAEVRYWRHEFGITVEPGQDDGGCGVLLAFAYPDRIAQRRSGGGYLLGNGRGAIFTRSQSLAETPYLVAAELDDRGSESKIYLAAPVELAQLEKYCAELIQKKLTIGWDGSCQAVRARQQKYLGSLLLADAPYGKPAVEDMLEGLLTGIQKNGLDKLPWAKGGDQLRQRLKFMQHRCPGWTDMSDEALLASCGEWLGPFLRGISSWQQLQKVDVVAALLTKLTAKERRELEEWAPTHIRVPGCRGVVVDYSDPEAPALAVRLQDLFGSNETPCIARGQVKLVLHILSPARRPVQVTQDLAGFWQTTYPSLRKGLMGRYPKHNWPEDPSKAKPNQPASR